MTETWEAIDTYEGVTYFQYTKKDYYKNGDVKTEYLCTQPVKLPVDADGNITSSTEAYRTLYKKDGQAAVQADYVVTDYTYYANGKIKTVSANNGYSAEYVYDNDGNVSSEIVNGVKNDIRKHLFWTAGIQARIRQPGQFGTHRQRCLSIDGEDAVLTTDISMRMGC